MKVTQSIIEMAKENNGVVTASMVSDSGISRGILKYLCDKGKTPRTIRARYIHPS